MLSTQRSLAACDEAASVLIGSTARCFPKHRCPKPRNGSPVWHPLDNRDCLFRSLLLLLVALAFPPMFLGQATEFGALNGTITDTSGSVIANAQVTALNIATNEQSTAQTNSAGQYRIFSLLPAKYTLTVKAGGFRSVQIAPFKIDVGQTLTQNATLSIGEVSQEVQVNGTGQLLQTANVGSTTTISAEQINDLPLNGRSYTSLIGLTPGAYNDGSGYRINGQWHDGNRFALDGANNTTVLGASSAYTPNLDIIQEFSIDSQSSKAEYGGFLGATVSAATKSGTNQLRGDIFEFLRTNQFVARNPISDPPGVAFPPYHFNQYGGVVGGPVYFPHLYDGHDKTFFFFGFQRSSTSQRIYNYSRVPTANELNGDFTDSLFFLASPNQVHLYDPATTTTGANPTRSPFPNDVIPPSRINSLAQSYIKYVSDTPNFTPNQYYPTDNRLDLFSEPSANNDYSIRIDQRVSTHDNLWGRYSQVVNSNIQPLTTQVLQTEAYDRKNLVIDWVHIFSPRLFLESNYAYGYFPTVENNVLPGAGVQALVGFGFSAQQITDYSFPDFNGTGVNTPYLVGNYKTLQTSPFSLNEALSWTLKNHTLKFGVNVSHKHFQNVGFGHHYYFSNLQTEDPDQSDPGAGNTGTGLASALLGLPQAINLYTGQYTESFWNKALYAEDQWKASAHVTISAGLRYDFYPTPNFTTGTINDWDFNTGMWEIGGGKLPPACNTSPVAPCIPGNGALSGVPYGNMIELAPYAGIRHPINSNFGPRVAVAWNLRPDTVVRAGYSIYYDVESNTAQEDQNTFGTWPSNTNVNLNYNTIGSQLTTINQIDGQALAPTTAAVPWGQQTDFWDPAKKNPKSQQYNVDVQQQLGKYAVFTLAYLGNYNTHNDLTIDVNGAETPGPGDAAVVNARRKWPFYGTDTHFGTDLGHSNYNALQAKLERRFANGFQCLLTYTFAKTMDNGSDEWYGGNVQNAYDVNAEYGISDADVKQISSMAATYELPFGRGKLFLNRGFAAYAVGGWQLNAIGSIHSGTPVVLTASGDPANIGLTQSGYARPNLTGNPYISHPSSKQWFNQADFSQPVYSYGNAPRGLFRNPGYQDADLSIFKNIPIHESLMFQLRLEAFNAFNLITRGGVDGNSTNNPQFGTIYTIGSTPRQLQFAGKLYF